MQSTGAGFPQSRLLIAEIQRQTPAWMGADHHREVGDNGQKGCFQPRWFLYVCIQLTPGVPIADRQQCTAAGGILAALEQKKHTKWPQEVPPGCNGTSQIEIGGKERAIGPPEVLRSNGCAFMRFCTPKPHPRGPPHALLSASHVHAHVHGTLRLHNAYCSHGRVWGCKTIKMP